MEIQKLSHFSIKFTKMPKKYHVESFGFGFVYKMELILQINHLKHER